MDSKSNLTSAKTIVQGNFLMVAFMLFVFLFVATTLVGIRASQNVWPGPMACDHPDEELNAANSPADSIRRDNIPLDGSAQAPESLYGAPGSFKSGRHHRTNSDKIQYGVER